LSLLSELALDWSVKATPGNPDRTVQDFFEIGEGWPKILH
jgi:hypothetical protein